MDGMKRTSSSYKPQAESKNNKKMNELYCIKEEGQSHRERTYPQSVLHP